VPSTRARGTCRLRFLFRRNGDQDASNGCHWKERLLTGQVEQIGLLYCGHWVRLVELARAGREDTCAGFSSWCTERGLCTTNEPC